MLFLIKISYNYSDLDSIRRLCGASSCDSNSLQSLVSSASFFPKQTFIAQAPVNWIDDYMDWLSADPVSTSCCFEYANTTYHTFCDHKRLLDDHSDRLDQCIPCRVERTKYNMPSERTMMMYIDNFLHQNPSQHCAKAGHAMYGSAVKLIRDKFSHVMRIGGKFLFHSINPFYALLKFLCLTN